MDHSLKAISLLKPRISHYLAASRVTLLLLLFVAPTFASPITLAVNPELVGENPLFPSFLFEDFPFGDQLNGTTLSGQSVSYDFLFADDILARVQMREGVNPVDFGLVLETNAIPEPGLPGSDTTGFLLAPDGTPIHPPLGPDQVARLSAFNGDLGVGLFPQVAGTFDMAGVHYDITLPNTGFVVTGGHIRIVGSKFIAFGTAAQLPEPSTLLLFGAGWACVAGLRTRLRRTH